ncbi:hypothetical protein BXO88_08230 [Oribacterium sp. C9]|nr:hypothetical protein BXO88_08230 [Oribacterium sp. C9]
MAEAAVTDFESGGVFHQENSDRQGPSKARVPKGSGEGLPKAEPDRRSAAGMVKRIIVFHQGNSDRHGVFSKGKIVLRSKILAGYQNQ